jgi:hypothetical protein
MGWLVMSRRVDAAASSSGIGTAEPGCPVVTGAAIWGLGCRVASTEQGKAQPTACCSLHRTEQHSTRNHQWLEMQLLTMSRRDFKVCGVKAVLNPKP